jgi:hypothetical protein
MNEDEATAGRGEPPAHSHAETAPRERTDDAEHRTMAGVR